MGQLLVKEWRMINASDDDADLSNNQLENENLDQSPPNAPPKSTMPKSSLQHDRLRVLQEDPRSPSGSISRTPIEVVATPDSKEGGGKTKSNFVDEYSPAPSPSMADDSPTLNLLKKTSITNNTATASDLQRKLFHRHPFQGQQLTKTEGYENAAEEDNA